MQAVADKQGLKPKITYSTGDDVLGKLEVERYLLPNLHAVNFVIQRLLGEGVSASTRSDSQARSLGEYLRAKVVDVPEALLG